tara:strand:+ start:5610 stop:5768 length:159 start_codon:yes stop_codon:yes gene_type:complete
MENIDLFTLLTKLWPIGLGFVTLVIVLAKMHANISTLQEKVKVLFDLHNKNS